MAAPASGPAGRVGPAPQNMPAPSAPPKSGSLNVAGKSAAVQHNPAHGAAAASVANRNIQPPSQSAAKITKPVAASSGDAKAAPGAAGVAQAAAKVADGKAVPNYTPEQIAMARKMASNISRNGALVAEAIRDILGAEMGRIRKELAKPGGYSQPVVGVGSKVDPSVAGIFAVDPEKLLADANVILAGQRNHAENVHFNKVLPAAVRELERDLPFAMLLDKIEPGIKLEQSKIVQSQVLKVNRRRPLHLD